MAQLQQVRKYEKGDRACYETALASFPKAGFKIWKTREIANLVMANRQENGQEASANLVVSGFGPSTVTLSLSGEGLSEEELARLGGEFFAAFESALARA